MTVHFINNSAVTAAAVRAANALTPATVGHRGKPPKDPTGAKRAREYRARKRGLVATDQCYSSAVTASVTPSVTVGVTPVTAPITDHVTAERVTILPPTRDGHPVLSGLTFVLGLVVAAIGLWLNARFAAHFGQTFEASATLAVIGLTIDGATMLLPAVIAALWMRRRIVLTLAAVPVYGLALTMTAISALGFASQNIGDAVAGRTAATNDRATFSADAARLRAERAALVFVPTTQSAVDAATTARDQECERVGENCRKRVLELASAIKERAATDRAADLDRAITTADRRLASLPAIGQADPQVETTVKAAAWLTAGHLRPEAEDVVMLRVIGLAFFPILGGLLFAFATALRRQ